MSDGRFGGERHTSAFFEALERGFSESTEEYHICTEIGGQSLTLSFPSQALAENVGQCFASWQIPETPEPDARLCFWSDDCSRYINQVPSSGRWRYREEDRWVTFVPDRWIIGADVPGHTFYYCRHDPERRASLPYWLVRSLVSQWAGTAELLPVHGGVVGVGGRGCC